MHFDGYSYKYIKAQTFQAVLLILHMALGCTLRLMQYTHTALCIYTGSGGICVTSEHLTWYSLSGYISILEAASYGAVYVVVYAGGAYMHVPTTYATM